MFCIDASVIISAARGTEVGSKSSLAFLEVVKRENSKVFFPEIAVVEVASALVRATARADFAVEFSRTLKMIPNFSFVSVDSWLAGLAVDVVGKTGLRAADAIYVALAIDYHLTLVTLDAEQISRAQKLIAVGTPDSVI